MRSTVAVVNTNHLLHNLEKIRQHTEDAEILAVIKANAYGHGAIEIARNLRQAGINYLGVAYLYEALELRQSGDNGNIILIVPETPDLSGKIVELGLETVLNSKDTLVSLDEEAKKQNTIINVHLFIDTGMHREGIKPGDSLQFLEFASEYKNVNIHGILTHLGAAEHEEKKHTQKQIEKFNILLEELNSSGKNFRFIHALNSAGILNFPEARYNMVRTGIALYGNMTEKALAKEMGLKPVLELKSRVVLIKDAAKGESVGYSRRYIAEKDTKIALVPIGYGDGYPWGLTNKGRALINGQSFRIAGSVCMDQLMLEIGEADVKIGDEVTLIGKQGDETIYVYELAELAGTVPYEITTNLHRRVQRVYTDVEK